MTCFWLDLSTWFQNNLDVCEKYPQSVTACLSNRHSDLKSILSCWFMQLNMKLLSASSDRLYLLILKGFLWPDKVFLSQSLCG